jgi:hypothetical protein
MAPQKTLFTSATTANITAKSRTRIAPVDLGPGFHMGWTLATQVHLYCTSSCHFDALRVHLGCTRVKLCCTNVPVVHKKLSGSLLLFIRISNGLQNSAGY